MPRRGPSSTQLAAHARARNLLSAAEANDDPRVAVLAVLLRGPRDPVTYIELRAECPELDGAALDAALAALVADGFAYEEHAPVYGIAYRVLVAASSPIVAASA